MLDRDHKPPLPGRLEWLEYPLVRTIAATFRRKNINIRETCYADLIVDDLAVFLWIVCSGVVPFAVGYMGGIVFGANDCLCSVFCWMYHAWLLPSCVLAIARIEAHWWWVRCHHNEWPELRTIGYPGHRSRLYNWLFRHLSSDDEWILVSQVEATLSIVIGLLIVLCGGFLGFAFIIGGNSLNSYGKHLLEQATDEESRLKRLREEEERKATEREAARRREKARREDERFVASQVSPPRKTYEEVRRSSKERTSRPTGSRFYAHDKPDRY